MARFKQSYEIKLTDELRKKYKDKYNLNFSKDANIFTATYIPDSLLLEIFENKPSKEIILEEVPEMFANILTEEQKSMLKINKDNKIQTEKIQEEKHEVDKISLKENEEEILKDFGIKIWLKQKFVKKAA